MAKIIRKRFLAVILTLTMMTGLLPAMELSASATVGADKIYYTESTTDHYHLQKANLSDGLIPQILYDDTAGTPDGIAVDAVNGYLYFSDPHTSVGKIYRYNLSNGDMVALISNVYANDLAIDTVNDKIYFTESQALGSDKTHYRLMKANLSDGSSLTTLYGASDSAGIPTGVAVDVKNSYVYFSDSYESVGKIYRCGFDGSGRITLISGVYANDLALDTVHGKIYYTESQQVGEDNITYYRLRRADISNGSNAETLYGASGDLAGTPTGVAVDADKGYVYFSDSHGTVGKIFRSGLDGSGRITLISGAYANDLAIPMADTTAPTISSASRTDNTQITVTLSESCKNLLKGNDGGFTVTKTGTATTYAVSATAQGTDTSHVVLTVADMSAAGSAGVKVTYATGGNGTIADMSDNALASTSTGATVAAWDTAAPTVSSINRNSPSTEKTNLTSVTYLVTFNEAVTGVDTTDFSLTTTESATGTVSAVSAVNGSTYDVTVNTISGEGTLQLDLKSSGTGIADIATNAISGGYNSGQTYSIDPTAPTVTFTSIDSTGKIVTLTFSEALDASTAIAGNFSGTAGAPTVTYSTGATALTLTYGTAIEPGKSKTIIVGAGVKDVAGNAITSVTFTEGSTSGFTGLDTTAPSVTKLGDGTKDYSFAASESATLTFSEALSSASQTAVQTALTSDSSQALGYSWSGAVLTITNTSSTSAAVFANDVTASVSDVAGNSATLTLVDSSADETAPTVSFTTIDSTGKVVTLTFSEALDATTAIVGSNFSGTAGTPTVSYTPGATTLTLTYGTTIAVGSGKTIIVGDGVKDVAGNAITSVTFTEGSTSGFTGVDTTAPTVSSINRNSPTTQTTNLTSVTYRVTFSESVTGVSASDFAPITISGNVMGTVSAVSAINGSTYDVTVSTISGEGQIRLDLNSSGTSIADSAANAISGGFTSGQTYAIDAVAPTISSGAVPSDGTYITGQNLDFTVTFSETVSVNTGSGTPYLTLTIGSTSVHATYQSGSGSSLVFRYSVVSDDYDADGIALSSNITLNGGTIRDDAGNDATVTHPGTTLTNVLVDGVAPTISGVTGPSAGTYSIGDELDFTATFSENVTVTGAPFISLTIGSSTVNAAYSSGSGTTSIKFQYTIVTGNADADGIACVSPVTLPAGAAIKDAAGNDLETLTFTPPTTTGVTVDAVAPTISSAVIASGNSYFDIVFNEGIYGASHGATALTAAKLALTFTKNSGSATNVTISSIKKNDNTSEASASELTGGETTVRVFLTVTGSPSGTETIEIKPANATSVYDFNGNAMASTETTGAKTLHAQGSFGSDSGSTGTGAAVIVNGKSQTAGTSQTTTSSSGQTTTTVTVDTDKLQTILDSQSSGATVTIPISGSSDVAAGTLTGAMIKSMEDKAATLVVQTSSGTYTLPAAEINIAAVSEQLGSNVSLSDIDVTVRISEPSASMTQVVESAAQDGGFTIMVPAVDYTITCTHGSQTVNVSSFNSYVERTIAIPDGVDPAKITTGVVINPDGTVHPVPTQIVLVNGKYYAKINSLTNSTYSVVWNPIEFTDVADHWAKDAINDMGSRMIVTGVGNNNFAPDKNMTRAEFAAIIVRALGLEPGTGTSGFGDVASTDWYSGYIKTAASYGIIKGYDNGNFGPNDTITREQAMTLIARAMRITGLTTDSPDVSKILPSYSDGSSVSAYAEESIAACIDTGIVSGRDSGTIAPKAYVTRAEVAVMVERLLQKSGLI